MARSPEEADFARQRERMVAEQLAQRGIRDERVLDAFRRVPREGFVPTAARGRAYADGALPIDCEQTISQPYMVARMSEALQLDPRKAVLEIGTGSGYQTAILACLAKQVYTIEWHLKLLNQAAERLRRIGLENVNYRCGDGSLGWPEQAPFDAIMVTAGAPEVPAPLRQQLAIGGRMIVPVGPPGDQTLLLIQRTEQGFAEQELLRCRFVKLLGKAAWRE